MQNDQGPGSAPSAEQRREEEIFDAAVVLPAEERSAYLDRACNGDASLRRRIEILLQSHRKAETFLEASVPATGNPTIAISLPAEKPKPALKPRTTAAKAARPHVTRQASVTRTQSRGMFGGFFQSQPRPKPQRTTTKTR